MKNCCGTLLCVMLAVTAARAEVLSPITDATDDAIDTYHEGGPLLDLTRTAVSYSPDNLHFELDFATPIRPTSDAAPESLLGLIYLDLDQDPTTGAPPPHDHFSPPWTPVPIGAEFAIQIDDSDDPGFGRLVRFTEFDGRPIALEFSEQGVSGSIPLEILDGDDGVANFVAIVGTRFQPTDATDVLGVSRAVPEPTTLAGLALAALLVRRR
jgi:hypothetical protein